MTGLVVDLGDDAGRAGAERVLRRGVGVAARGERSDVEGRAIRRPLDLVKVPAIRRVERAHGAVRRDAGRAGRSVDVARERRRCLRRARDGRQGAGERDSRAHGQKGFL